MIFENMWALLVVVAISLFGAAEVGYRVGLSLNRTKDDARRSQIGGVQGAVLGLLGLLIIVAASGCFISGYGSGAQGARSLFTMAFLPALITVVILLVFDLTHSHQGIIVISQQPLIDLQNSMSAATNTAAK